MVKHIDTPLLMKEVDCLKTRKGIWQIYLNSRFCSTLFASLFLLREKQMLILLLWHTGFLFQSSSFHISYFFQPINHQRRFPDKISFVDPVYSYDGLDVGKIYLFYLIIRDLISLIHIKFIYQLLNLVIIGGRINTLISQFYRRLVIYQGWQDFMNVY